MQILCLTRQNENYYEILGPIFGSRIVEQQTKDRFYDDPGKLWYCIKGHGVLSILNNSIRNFWASDDEAAGALLQAVIAQYDELHGIICRIYEKPFAQAGFRTTAYRKNFMEVHYYAKDDVH